MTAPGSAALTPAQRRELKARAHALDPVVIVGDAGLTDAVLAEIDRGLVAHELIKVRVAGDDREQRVSIRDRIVAELGAAPVQHIGKLLVLYRPAPPEPAAPRLRRPAAKKVARKSASPRSPFAPKPSTRKTAAGARPPRSERIRKSGQRSAKKPHQGR